MRLLKPIAAQCDCIGKLPAGRDIGLSTRQGTIPLVVEPVGRISSASLGEAKLAPSGCYADGFLRR